MGAMSPVTSRLQALIIGASAMALSKGKVCTCH